MGDCRARWRFCGLHQYFSGSRIKKKREKNEESHMKKTWPYKNVKQGLLLDSKIFTGLYYRAWAILYKTICFLIFHKFWNYYFFWYIRHIHILLGFLIFSFMLLHRLTKSFIETNSMWLIHESTKALEIKTLMVFSLVLSLTRLFYHVFSSFS